MIWQVCLDCWYSLCQCLILFAQNWAGTILQSLYISKAAWELLELYQASKKTIELQTLQKRKKGKSACDCVRPHAYLSTVDIIPPGVSPCHVSLTKSKWNLWSCKVVTKQNVLKYAEEYNAQQWILTYLDKRVKRKKTAEEIHESAVHKVPQSWFMVPTHKHPLRFWHTRKK